MSATVIRLRQIGKRFGLAHYLCRGRDSLARALRDPLSLEQRKLEETLLALKDISFEVREGEVPGLIGPPIEILKDDYLSMVDDHGPHTGHVTARPARSCTQIGHSKSGGLISAAGIYPASSSPKDRNG